MRKRITVTAVNALRPSNEDCIYWDTLLPGFGVRCRVSGHKYYLVKYRVGHNQRWITLGKHGELTPDQARKQAVKILNKVEGGADPSGRGGADVVTVADLCGHFMAAHAPDLKANTTDMYTRWIDLHINPALGKLPISEVGYDDIDTFHRGLRHKRTTANRCLAVLSSMFNWADAKGLRQGDNPCRKVKRYKEQAKERFLSEAELQRLLDVLDKHETAEPYVVAAVRLLTLTGCRKSEILTLRWDYVDFDRACLWLPDTKTGKRRIVLNKAAVDLLRALQRVDDNPYVIVGKGGHGHLVGLHRAWDRIRREAKLSDVRVHDLRHSFASFGIDAGLSLPVIGGLLGHKSTATTAKYAHLADGVLRQGADAIGDLVTNGKGKKKGG